MKLSDKATGKIVVEASSNDEFMACHHATVVITEELTHLVCELQALAEAYKDKLDYVAAFKCFDVEFFDYEDSTEPMPIEGLTLHVDRFDYWFTAWVKNTGFRLETNNL
jgi:hypothetical protein